MRKKDKYKVVYDLSCVVIIYSSYSIRGAHMNLFYEIYSMDERKVYATWMCMCKNNEDVIRVLYR